MRKKLLALLLGSALLAFAIVLTGCTEDSNGGGCKCQADGNTTVTVTGFHPCFAG